MTTPPPPETGRKTSDLTGWKENGRGDVQWNEHRISSCKTDLWEQQTDLTRDVYVVQTCTRVRDIASTSVWLLSGRFQFSGDTWTSCLHLARRPLMAAVRWTYENSHHCRGGQQAQRSVLYGNNPSPLGSLRDRTSQVYSWCCSASYGSQQLRQTL